LPSEYVKNTGFFSGMAAASILMLSPSNGASGYAGFFEHAGKKAITQSKTIMLFIIDIKFYDYIYQYV
ncbi:MAG: hypothetical protein OEW04_13600, partial [Nitrospirota bacterium]|nr:hypothetical protein [Nitrospirota bacterium]